MKRRDLNPGDVFVYLEYPVNQGPKPVVGATGQDKIRYVWDGESPPWFDGAVASPSHQGIIQQPMLDAKVLKIERP